MESYPADQLKAVYEPTIRRPVIQRCENPEPKMKTLEFHDHEAGRLFRRIINFLGDEGIEKRLSAIEREVRSSKGLYLENWVKPNREWWFGLKEARRLIAAGQSFRGRLTSAMLSPLKTAAMVNLLFSSMKEDSRRLYRTRLLPDASLNPVLFELQIATQFKLEG